VCSMGAKGVVLMYIIQYSVLPLINRLGVYHGSLVELYIMGERLKISLGIGHTVLEYSVPKQFTLPY
jgi:hypothetical protein